MNGAHDGWLDTNVILRFLIGDHEEMSGQTKVLFEKAEQGLLKLYLHELTVAELVWTLECYYGYTKSEIFGALTGLIEADGIMVPQKESIRSALFSYYENDVDFVDAYLSSQAVSNGPDVVYTFDKKHFSLLDATAVFPKRKFFGQV